MNKPEKHLVNPLIVVMLFAIAWACGLTPAGLAQSKPEKTLPAFRDPSLPIEKRVDDLVSRLSLDEKVQQMQYTAPEITRLGIPSYNWWSEALHGVARSGYATVFPQAIGMAATWDQAMVHQEGETIATEGRAKYNQAQREGNHNIFFGLDFWSPNINIFRDPRWGRGQETYGEDPFLTARLGLAFVTGVQGDDPKYLKAVATPKHYAVHSGPDPQRHEFNVNVLPHDLEDTYLPAFRATVVEGHADSVMCAYNSIDGVPACTNKFLLQTTLREAWKFQGYVTSDCGAVGNITGGHHFTPDNEHGSALAVLAGTDTTCGHEYVALVKAVQEGLITESEIDTDLKRLFTARIRLGMFDPPSAVAFNRIPFSENDSAQHRALALKAARESIVLLKNQDGILPFKSNVKTIAVIGPNAESLVALEGNYNGVPSHPVYPLGGMRKVFGGKAKILSAQGSPYVASLALPVPSNVFHTSEAAGAEGLQAEYFSNTTFSGKPALTRIDPRIQFDWNAAAPAPGINREAFGVRWTGTLTPPGPGDYTFSVGKAGCWPCEDKETFRVYLDGKPVLDAVTGDYVKQGATTTFQAHFTDQQPHTFRLEYVHQSVLWGAGITLEWQPPADVLREEAVKIAEQADVVVAFVGLSPHLEGEEMPIHVPGFEGGDRTDIGLPQAEQDLLVALAGTGKPLVVELMNGSALAVNWAQEHAAAIVEAWYPGEEGGTAIAETLAGVNNPGGRLPLTFYASLDQLPPFDDYNMQNRTYRYFQGKPLYGFGYGQSYSNFEYTNLKLSSPQIKAGEDLTVTVEVQNASKIAGDEVAELYLEFPQIPGAPVRALRGFERRRIGPGETRRVTYTLKARDLSMVSEAGEHKVMPGEYTLFVGGAQPGDAAGGVSAKLTISGELKLAR
ncbi:MAG: glycoside hydrolase family 3 C-terminal domain-containing protein [Acidobacteriota bacterium]|nr:glycoside hydrolase family 3 C-terminal domain-containing protein [Acidobacteriota bacterium]